jgi:hypothetical protein
MLQERSRLRNNFGKWNLRLLCRPATCHGPDATDDFGGPSCIAHDAFCEISNFLQIGFRPVQPAQRCLAIRDNRSEGLIDLVRDRCGQGSKTHHSADVCEFESTPVPRLFGKPAARDILNRAKTFETTVLMTVDASKDPHPLYTAVRHSQPHFVLGIVETCPHQCLIVSEHQKMVRMNTLADQLKARLGVRFNLENPTQFL